MNEKPTVRWSQLLKPLREEVTPDLQGRFDRGKEIHVAIQSVFPQWCKEKSGEYDDLGLPFKIAFHADLFSQVSRTVIEIKPFVWGQDNEGYCLRQVSGYSHFLDARKVKVLWYHWEHYPTWPPVFLIEQVEPIPWSVLRGEALRNFTVLQGASGVWEGSI